jgi:aspartate aminotransferase
MSFLISVFTGYLTKEKRIANSTELIDYLLDEANVAAVRGAAFGSDANIRLSYATSLKNIEEGIKTD